MKLSEAITEAKAHFKATGMHCVVIGQNPHHSRMGWTYMPVMNYAYEVDGPVYWRTTKAAV